MSPPTFSLHSEKTYIAKFTKIYLTMERIYLYRKSKLCPQRENSVNFNIKTDLEDIFCDLSRSTAPVFSCQPICTHTSNGFYSLPLVPCVYEDPLTIKKIYAETVWTGWRNAERRPLALCHSSIWGTRLSGV